MTIHLASPLPARSSDLPGDLDGPPSDAPLFGLAPGGVYQAPAVTGRSGELLPHPFTLTPGDATHQRRRFPFCGTFLPVSGTGNYPAPCPAEPGLSSPPPQRRSSGHLSCFNMVIVRKVTNPFLMTSAKSSIFLSRLLKFLVVRPIDDPIATGAGLERISPDQFVEFLWRNSHMTGLTDPDSHRA